jgi:hypothetical protein
MSEVRNRLEAERIRELEARQKGQQPAKLKSDEPVKFRDYSKQDAADSATFKPLGEPSTSAQNEGEQINEVGNRVIVPKDGESFSDTMKRAADYGKTVTPKQIDAEMQTAPKKAAQVLVAAPLIGAGIPAAEAGLAEIPGAGKVILDRKCQSKHTGDRLNPQPA